MDNNVRVISKSKIMLIYCFYIIVIIIVYVIYRIYMIVDPNCSNEEVDRT